MNDEDLCVIFMLYEDNERERSNIYKLWMYKEDCTAKYMYGEKTIVFCDSAHMY